MIRPLAPALRLAPAWTQDADAASPTPARPAPLRPTARPESRPGPPLAAPERTAGAVARPPGAVMLAEAGAGPGRQPNLLARLGEDDRALLLKLARRRVVYRGKMVFAQGDPHDGIWLIESGLVRVFYVARNGREITLAYWAPGNFVGGPQIYEGGAHIWSAVAARTSVLLALSARDLRHMMERSHEFALGVVDGLIFKGKCYSALAQMLGTRSAGQRLRHLLVNLAELYGVPERDGIVIGAGFSHQDLANMVGATRQWVSISLARLKAEGVVHAARGKFVVRRLDRLRAESGGDGA
jgi:CRP/FNR family transcriptional regulator, cyclic AMP receptor protein